MVLNLNFIGNIFEVTDDYGKNNTSSVIISLYSLTLYKVLFTIGQEQGNILSLTGICMSYQVICKMWLPTMVI